MTHKAEHEKVAQIVSWKTDAFYIVEVVYRDGKTATLYNVTVDHWAAIKAEELEHELAERNAETGTVRDIPKLPAKIKNLENVRQIQRRSFITSCRELNIVHLCAWCRSYAVTGWDGEEHVLIRLEDNEFEATRMTGESHGICQQCRNGQIAACRDMKVTCDKAKVKSEDTEGK